MVVGVIKDVPRNSSLIFDGMVTLELLPKILILPITLIHGGIILFNCRTT